MRFRMLRPAALLAATLMLAGCVPSETVVTVPSEPAAAPIFASDEEALAAATEAYAKYLEVSDLIRSESGLNPERIADYVTLERLQNELDGFKNFADRGESTVGSIGFDSVKLQRYEDEADNSATVVMYLCLDATRITIVDRNGNHVAREMPKRQLFEITMVSGPIEVSKMILSGSELWSAKSGC